MAARVFPTMPAPDYPLQEDFTDHALKMQADNETIMTRPRFTTMPKSFKVSWSRLPTAYYNKLRAFYEECHGGALSFQWTYPKDEGNDYSEKTFTVRFADSSLSFQLVELDKWSGTITLQEAPPQWGGSST